MKRLEAWARRATAVLGAALLVSGVTGCVETALYEKATLDLDGARRESAQKDQQIHALQWQLASAGQQAQALSQQNAAVVGDLQRRVQEAAAATRTLAERVQAKEQETEQLRLAVARAEEEASAKHGPPGPAVRLRPEDLKRIEAAASARDAEVSKLLARLEKILGERAVQAASPGDQIPRRGDADFVDPWKSDRK
jgi:uncharacterized protein YhaN